MCGRRLNARFNLQHWSVHLQRETRLSLVPKLSKKALVASDKHVYLEVIIAETISLLAMSSFVCSVILHFDSYLEASSRDYLVAIVRSRWVDQWKNVNNLAVLHAIDTRLALIDCMWNVLAIHILKIWSHGRTRKQLNRKLYTLGMAYLSHCSHS